MSLERLPADLLAELLFVAPDIYSSLFSVSRTLRAALWSPSLSPFKVAFEALKSAAERLRLVDSVMAEDIYYGSKVPDFDALLLENRLDALLDEYDAGSFGNMLCQCRVANVLHRAVEKSASTELILRLVCSAPHMCFLRTDGLRPVDVARRKRNRLVAFIVHPRTFFGSFRVPDSAEAEMRELEEQLHKLILKNRPNLATSGTRLPDLDCLRCYCRFNCRLWFPVPGMYGGYGTKLAPWHVVRAHAGSQIQAVADELGENCNFALFCDSFIRICGGSEENHVVTRNGFVSYPDPDFAYN